ncbi:MAG: PQQ-dependent sugar dehydrogenase [Solirubrobacterales bacterium]
MRYWLLLVAFVVPTLALGALVLALRDGRDELAGSVGSVPSAGDRPVAVSRARLSRIGTFTEPVYVTAPPGDTKRVFVVQQNGKIIVLAGGKRRTFLDISGSIVHGGEQGLLSMAFAPDYSTSGRFYVDFTDRKGDTRIQEFKRSSNPNRADVGSRRQVLSINQPFSNHNGGLVLFGPDKLLYVGMGDGGSAGDPRDNAQDMGSLLGKILRIDPTPAKGKRYSVPGSNPFVGRAGRDEIYTFGMRNPWRFSFDPRNGDMYIADVGQGEWEEINYASRGAASGRDYGWSCREGRHTFDSSRRCPDPVDPVLEYSHAGGGCSVTGGVVVNDSRLPSLRGRYIYGDFCKGQLRSFKIVNGRATGDRSLGLHVDSLSSFGTDGRGRVYVTSLSGPVYRVR